MNQKEIQRFQKKIELDTLTGCWLWKGSKDSSGYGKIGCKGKLIGAHRLSYQHWNGLIPNDKQIDHLCRNRTCVNPLHLEAITHKENCKRGDLRSNNWNKRKTHCPQGHELKEPNLVISQLIHGKRNCKICTNQHARQHNIKLGVK